MKTVIYALVGLLLLPVSISAQNWQMVWSDEFDGDSLDMALWSYQTGTGSEYGLTDWGNNELQYYREQNVSVGEGMLTITAKKESSYGKSYTSGRIRTLDKGDWKYCRIEFRAKMPRGQGLWAAVWMLPTELDYGGWAASGEIDIVEFLGHETSKVHGTLHFGGAWPNNKSNGTSYETTASPFSTEFHDFALEWVEGKMKWYVDGALYQTQDEGGWYSSAAAFPAPFDKKFHLLINLAVGGNWPGSPDGSTQFPQEIQVDYIRIYQDLPVGILQEVNPEIYENKLGQNFPNPFLTKTSISYTIPEQAPAALEVFDAIGRKIFTLADGEHLPGKYSVNFDGSDMPRGLYSYRLVVGNYQETKQMLLLGE